MMRLSQPRKMVIYMAQKIKGEKKKAKGIEIEPQTQVVPPNGTVLTPDGNHSDLQHFRMR